MYEKRMVALVKNQVVDSHDEKRSDEIRVMKGDCKYL